MKRDNFVGNRENVRKFVVAYWFRLLMQDRMKAKYLKRLEMYKVRINPALDRYLEVALFQEKLDTANATLASIGLPAGWEARP
jgi:hypothetical protein